MTERDRTDDAGVAHATPASSSRPGVDVVPEPARRELDRVRRRWSELSSDRVATAAPRLREAVVAVAARTDDAEVADLGPAVLPGQLTVVVWDAYAAGAADGLDAELTALRRDLP